MTLPRSSGCTRTSRTLPRRSDLLATWTSSGYWTMPRTRCSRASSSTSGLVRHGLRLGRLGLLGVRFGLDRAALGGVVLGRTVLGHAVLGGVVLGRAVLGGTVLGGTVLGGTVLGGTVLGGTVPGRLGRPGLRPGPALAGSLV